MTNNLDIARSRSGSDAKSKYKIGEKVYYGTKGTLGEIVAVAGLGYYLLCEGFIYSVLERSLSKNKRKIRFKKPNDFKGIQKSKKSILP